MSVRIARSSPPWPRQPRRRSERRALDAVADRGYFSSEEILACEEAGDHGHAAQADDLRRNRPKGRFGKQDFATCRRRTSIVARPAKSSTYHYTNEENGLMLRRYWTSACQTCAIKRQLHAGQRAPDHPMGA